MRDGEAWKVIAGVAVAIATIAVLASTPSAIFSQSVAIVDTELRQTGPDAQRVLTRFELGDSEQLSNLPQGLGEWRSIAERDWDPIAERLSVNVLLSRDYERRDLYQTVNLLVIQSTNVSSFHPAPVCYRAQGWDVPDDGGQRVEIRVPNGTWAQESWLSDQEPRVFNGTTGAKLLEATKKNAAGEIIDKRVAMYVYLKTDDWRVTKEITWIRTEIAVPADTPAEQVAPILESLLAEALPHVFHFDGRDEMTIAEMAIDRFGPSAWGALVAAVALPLGFAMVPFLPTRDRPSAHREGPK